jgi:hypothetical protein
MQSIKMFAQLLLEKKKFVQHFEMEKGMACYKKVS